MRGHRGGVDPVHNGGSVAPQNLRVSVFVHGELGEAKPVNRNRAILLVGPHLLGDVGWEVLEGAAHLFGVGPELIRLGGLVARYVDCPLYNTYTSDATHSHVHSHTLT